VLPLHSPVALRPPLVLGLLLAAACTGQIDAGSSLAPAGGGPAGVGPQRGPDGTPIVGAAGANAGGPAAPGVTPGVDAGRVAIHRLNNAEYDNTVRDLLGVASTPARSFIADEKAAGFDNIATALGMTAAQYEQYFQTADALVEEVWADDALRNRILTCAPSGDDGGACAEKILLGFGLRAYRRPLEPDELARLQRVVDAAAALGESFERTIAQAVKAMLSSAAFLYRVELDPDPSSTVPHDLSPYELASRLSYLLWITMPDERLFAKAADASLLDDATLTAEVTRMLDDARAERFVESFAGQWLGMRALQSHQVDTSIFPDWNESRRDAMVAEGLAYFDEFLRGGRGMDEFFTAPTQSASDPDEARRGFLGLSSFLTFSSYSYRTAPTLRGKWVLENLLCEDIAPPPAGVPPLDDAKADPADLQSQNVRVRLAAHRENPSCASCHTLLDPVGFGLEHFDAIGAYRERYDDGDAIDASGELPGGLRFDGLTELSGLLADDERLPKCASEKLTTFALGRELEKSDAPYLESIREGWRADGLGLAALIERIVLSDLFRTRHGEAP
jgi:hypothetical protein